MYTVKVVDVYTVKVASYVYTVKVASYLAIRLATDFNRLQPTSRKSSMSLKIMTVKFKIMTVKFMTGVGDMAQITQPPHTHLP